MGISELDLLGIRGKDAWIFHPQQTPAHTYLLFCRNGGDTPFEQRVSHFSHSD